MVGAGRMYVYICEVRHHAPQFGYPVYIHNYVGAFLGSGDCWAHLDMRAHARAGSHRALQ